MKPSIIITTEATLESCNDPASECSELQVNVYTVFHERRVHKTLLEWKNGSIELPADVLLIAAEIVGIQRERQNDRRYLCTRHGFSDEKADPYAARDYECPKCLAEEKPT